MSVLVSPAFSVECDWVISCTCLLISHCMQLFPVCTFKHYYSAHQIVKKMKIVICFSLFYILVNFNSEPCHLSKCILYLSLLVCHWPQVGRTTLGGLLALGYNVVVSYKRSCTSVHNGQILLALESIDTLNETFLVLKGTSRKVWIP